MSEEITPLLLLQAYASGIFPMSESASDPEIFWVNPENRGVFEIGKFHISRSLRRQIRQGNFEVRFNSCFADVVRACADRPETWINAEIFNLYCKLHEMGYAHSQEIFVNNQLVGGVYGVTLGTAFFGESMFSRAPNGSKLALAYLMQRLEYGGYTLFDTQFITDHLASLGAIEIPRADYQARLKHALKSKADITAIDPGFSKP
ncbi:leucyl/phenylalanyl-tRNA--protein transferase [Amylibacter marinus]|uniref:Leucyl/phenylalanyl-tRNA--protein transferase n=1 Tax=Amylibacter marinus TaxID=1475483 RepID=A0ABQ5VSW7_9RHOB|nr:leucyl/phenylalanyl-tRNA--protein transferase [Amylibacter marinus]GLQ34357.1 leucyl/phenylalanyl-tRNA--protein transferase [Amylibacter marinus]